MLKIGEASPGGAGRNRTLGLEKLMAIRVPVPPLAAQQTFDRLQAYVAALKAKHAAIRQANASLLPATLERLFAGSA
jgi:type I restriction enzyme, S subunit